MSDALFVHLSRGTLLGIEPDASGVTTTGDLELVFRNHGRAVHVHVAVEGPLADYAAPAESNLLVDTDGEATVAVPVDPVPEPVSGTLRIESGYGAETERVDVTANRHEPDVEESLTSTQAARSGGGGAETAGDRVRRALANGGTRLLAALSAAAVVLAAGALWMTGSVVVLLGALVVTVVAVVAVGLLVRG